MTPAEILALVATLESILQTALSTIQIIKADLSHEATPEEQAALTADIVANSAELAKD